MMLGSNTNSGAGNELSEDVMDKQPSSSGAEWTSGGGLEIIGEFSDWADKVCRERVEREQRQQEEAIARVEAARLNNSGSGGAGGGGVPMLPLSASQSEDETWNAKPMSVDDLQGWIADEKHYAATILTALRAQYARTRKPRAEVKAAHSVLVPKTGKLSPEGAAEMARARVAAAAAAEAMGATTTEDAVSAVESATRVVCGRLLEPMRSLRPSSDFDTVRYANTVFKGGLDAEAYRDCIGSVTTAVSVGGCNGVGDIESQGQRRVEFTEDTVFQPSKRQ